MELTEGPSERIKKYFRDRVCQRSSRWTDGVGRDASFIGWGRDARGASCQRATGVRKVHGLQQ